MHTATAAPEPRDSVVIDTITNTNTNPMSTSMKKVRRSLEPGVGAVAP